jgi:Glycosyltransferase family 87
MDAADHLGLTPAARWRLAAERALRHSLLVWPLAAMGWMILVASRSNSLAFDFHHAYLPAAHAVLAGHSPYPPVSTAAAFPRTAYIYPPLAAYLAAPFVLVPAIVADAVVVALGIAFVVAILRLLGVRDWRCYAVSLLWVPTYSAIQTGNLTLLLALGIALLWRHRDRPAVAAAIAGTLLALKLFTWPLLVWLIATRRVRAAGGAVATAALLTLGSWAGIGFAGLTGYPHLLDVLTRAERGDGYTIPALLAGTVGWGVAESVGVAVGLAVLALAYRAAVKRDETRSLALAIGSMLLLTPIVGMHYFAFALVVLAILVPRFGWIWAVPLLFWVGPQGSNGAPWQTAAVLAVAAWVLAVATSRSRVAHERGGFLRS